MASFEAATETVEMFREYPRKFCSELERKTENGGCHGDLGNSHTQQNLWCLPSNDHSDTDQTDTVKRFMEMFRHVMRKAQTGLCLEGD